MSETPSEPAKWHESSQTARCPCGAVLATFDEEAAKNMSAAEIRKRWPRKECSRCKTIIYASALHFALGDW